MMYSGERDRVHYAKPDECFFPCIYHRKSIRGFDLHAFSAQQEAGDGIGGRGALGYEPAGAMTCS